MKNKLLIILLSGFFLLTISCRKDTVLSGTKYNIEFSNDTILFDTLFTTIGSTTKYFKFYNNNSGTLNVGTIGLAGGTQSPFRINVDGASGVSFNDIEIKAGDSMFVFVEVTIDPNQNNLPLIVEDSILFSTNGNIDKVVLNAWGQDAHFHVNELVEGTWTNDKPHVIYGVAAVGYPTLDSNKTLTIEAGTKVHGHANAALYVYKSSLIVNGTLNSPVVFQQDRTEDYLLYSADSSAGQWRGLYLYEPKTSLLENAEIKNATIGVQIDTNSNNESVTLDKIKVNNSLYANILTQGANVIATNCLFGSCNNFSAFISIGGNVSFEHCTFSNYWSNSRNTPAFVLKNYYESINDDLIFRPFNQADFKNCIFYGSTENEFFLDTLENFNTTAVFTNSIIRIDTTLDNQTVFNNCFVNEEPYFQEPYFWNFDITDSSNAINNGTTSTLFEDLLGRPRLAPNDLGCYEYQ
jgi:hypothetical protein